MQRIALLSFLLVPLMNLVSFAQDKEEPDMVERAFLKRLEGDWVVSQALVDGIPRNSPNFQLRFTKDSAEFVNPMAGETCSVEL